MWANASLTRQGSVTVPARIQYVCRHTMAHTLYVGSSNFVPMGEPDRKHHISAFRINSTTGALTEFAQPGRCAPGQSSTSPWIIMQTSCLYQEPKVLTHPVRFTVVPSSPRKRGPSTGSPLSRG
jgi:hypothetical protein